MSMNQNETKMLWKSTLMIYISLLKKFIDDEDRGSEQSRSGVGLASRKANGSFDD